VKWYVGFVLFHSSQINKPDQGFDSSNLDFSRFGLYAPYVRSLEIYKDRYFTLLGWGVLTSTTHRRPILPKLSSLTIHTKGIPSLHRTLYIGWVNWFMCPSLTSILVSPKRFGFDGLMISSLEGSAILQAVVDGCPRIRRLSLPLSDGYVGDSDQANLLLGLLRTKPLDQYLPALSDLCELQASTFLLRPDLFRALGSLPRLTSLTLYCLDEEPPLDSAIAFHTKPFPALKKLLLMCLDALEVIALLDLLPVLENLTSLELDMSLNTDGDWLIVDLFPRLEKLLRLSDLRLSIDFSLDMIRSNYHHISDPVALGILTKLPLQAVKLVGVSIRASVGLSTVFPNVKRLEMLGYQVYPNMLSPFAAMPNLEHLVVSLILDEDFLSYNDSPPGSLSLKTLEVAQAGRISCNTADSIHAAECATVAYIPLMKLC
jgi:hypothetical protein